MTLKTLKELGYTDAYEDRVVNLNELRQAAREWVKELEKDFFVIDNDNPILKFEARMGEGVPFSHSSEGQTLEAFILYFFNLEEKEKPKEFESQVDGRPYCAYETKEELEEKPE